MTNPKRFVFDTNTLVSALLFEESVPAQAVWRARREGQLLHSQATLAELKTVLARPKFAKYVTVSEREDFFTALQREAVVVNVIDTVNDCRDPKDNKFLELALSGQADFIISGDDDLLVLHPFRGIDILTPRKFIDSPD
ncbi:MAG: putative toxin-antitoxin system toxin component, PIN family [Anaerolineae bacterium]